MPIRARVHLNLDRPELVKTQDLHFHVCRWLEVDDAAHGAGSKPFALTPLMISDGSAAFDVGLLDDTLIHRLTSSVAADGHRTIAVGHATAQLHPGRGVEIVDVSSWPDLLNQDRLTSTCCGEMTWRLHALTPTFWRSRNVDLVEPRAGSIIRGLANKCELHYPASVAAHASPTEKRPVPRVVMGETDIAYSAMSWRRTTRRGFVGHVDLSLQTPDPAGAARVDALLSLAEFCGVGSMTPFGFGVVAVERLATPHAQPNQAQFA